MNGKSSEDAAGCGRHHSIPSSIWFLGIKITRLETTLTRWVPHVESQTREISIIYITVIYHLSLDRCCFLSINTWPVFFVDFWLDPGLLDQKIAEELLNWTDPTHWSVQIKAPCCTRFFNGKVVVVVKWQSEMGMLTLPWFYHQAQVRGSQVHMQLGCQAKFLLQDHENPVIQIIARYFNILLRCSAPLRCFSIF